MTNAETGPLGEAQVARYRREGFVLLPPGFLPGRTLETVASVMPAALADDGPHRIMERDGSTVRSVYGLHRSVPELADLARTPALLSAARQLLGDDVYVHQSKINLKAAFGGDQWEWHQDYIYWLHGDGIRKPDLLNVAIFLDEVTEFNGPLTFIPGSHTEGVLSGEFAEGMPLGYEDAPAWVATLTADEKFQVRPEVIADLACRNGLRAPKGPAGSVLVFDPNILHSSGPNISPFRRAMLMFVYNAVGNAPHPVPNPRPAFLAEPDFSALQPLPANA